MTRLEAFKNACALYLSIFLVVCFGLLIVITPFCSFVLPTNKEVIQYYQKVSCDKAYIIERYRMITGRKNCTYEEDVAFKLFDGCKNKEVIVCGRANPINYKLRIIP